MYSQIVNSNVKQYSDSNQFNLCVVNVEFKWDAMTRVFMYVRILGNIMKECGGTSGQLQVIT